MQEIENHTLGENQALLAALPLLALPPPPHPGATPCGAACCGPDCCGGLSVRKSKGGGDVVVCGYTFCSLEWVNIL